MKEKLANKKNIRTVDFQGLKIGAENDFNFINGVKPFFVLNLPVMNWNENFDVVKMLFKDKSVEEIVEIGNSSCCDILALKFNIDDILNIEKSVETLKKLLPKISKPLMIRGCGIDDIDKLLIPELIKNLDRECIISTLNENNYKLIVPLTVENNHIISIRTPIDINLAKEMNILVNDLGQDLNKILIDSDIGGLGYGLDYGYSIMEKIKLEGFFGDEYLNMPLISFVGEESLKTKEAKASDFNSVYGEVNKRALMIEIASVSSVIAAGANVVVVNNPKVIEVMKGLV